MTIPVIPQDLYCSRNQGSCTAHGDPDSGVAPLLVVLVIVLMLDHLPVVVLRQSKCTSGLEDSAAGCRRMWKTYLGQELGLHLLEHGEGDSGGVFLVRDAAVDAVAVVRDEMDAEHAPLHRVALARLHERVWVRHELKGAVRCDEASGAVVYLNNNPQDHWG